MILKAKYKVLKQLISYRKTAEIEGDKFSNMFLNLDEYTYYS